MQENLGPRSPAPLSPDRYKKRRREIEDEDDSQESRERTERESGSAEEPLSTPTDPPAHAAPRPLFATPGAANQSNGRPPRRGGGGGGGGGGELPGWR